MLQTPRKVYSLANEWRFYRGKIENCYEKNFDDTSWEVVYLPHTVREEAADCSGGKNYLGECCYRRRVQLNFDSNNQRATLRIGGAKHICRVYIDSKFIFEHAGGYIPFVFDVTSELADGNEHILAILIDNSDVHNIPPGKAQGALDFCYFGGLYRDVTLTVTDKLHITNALEEDEVAGGGVFVRYSHVGEKSATVHIKSHVKNNGTTQRSFKIKSRIINHEGVVVTEKDSSKICLEHSGDHYEETTMLVEQPYLWHPSTPYLYKLVVQIIEDEIVDEITEQIGIRTIDFTNEGFLINGEKLKLFGANRHQEYVHIGDAVPNALQHKDAELMKESGFNIIRTGHYPHGEAFMDACDALGLMCIVPTPGWHWYIEDPVFINRVYQDIRSMIRWHRNRPSVILWEPVLNETLYSEEFGKTVLEITRSEYPGDQCFAAAELSHPWTEHFDVSYPSPSHDKQAAFVREYGDMWLEQFGRKGTNFRCTRGKIGGFYPAGEKAMLQSSLERAASIQENICNDLTSGGALWLGFDTNRGYINNPMPAGVFDIYRLPKFSMYLFKSQSIVWDKNAESMIFIPTWWQKEGETNRDIYVFTNCESVELSINNKLISNGERVHNLQCLPSPPFIFKNVNFEEGILKAKGYNAGKLVCEYSVRTPEKPVAICLRRENQSNKWTANGSDIEVIRIEIKDENGTTVPVDGVAIAINIDGEGTKVGANSPWTMTYPIISEAGISTILVRSTNTAGKVIVSARADGLIGSSIEFSSIDIDSTNDIKLLPTNTLIKPVLYPKYLADNQKWFSKGEEITLDENYNIALHRPVTASSEVPMYPAIYSVYADDFGGWKAEEGLKQATWQIDLEGIYRLTEYRIMWTSDRHHYTCKMLGSVDGKEYFLVVNEHTYSGQDIEKIKIESKPLRYFKLEITDATGQIGIQNVHLMGDLIEVL